MRPRQAALTLVLCCALVLGGAGCGSKVATTWTNLHPTGDLPSARGLHSLVFVPSAVR